MSKRQHHYTTVACPTCSRAVRIEWTMTEFGVGVEPEPPTRVTHKDGKDWTLERACEHECNGAGSVVLGVP